MNKTAFFLNFLFICLISGSNTKAAIREPVVAGTFYPADSTELAKKVAGDLANAENLPRIGGQLIALIVPHAGLNYSGGIAAHSYKLLENSMVNKVILCGPSHQFGFRGVSVYGPGIEWETPLGTIRCDDDLCNQLLKFDNGIAVNDQAHAREHCLEVQLPYLQTVLKKFQIVPLVMGYQDDATINTLADALKALNFDSGTVMVASTDWQHYRPASKGWKMDSLGIECLKQIDPERLERYLEEGDVEACGGGPAVAVLKAAIAKGADEVRILKYGDSGDLTGDKSAVVGYVAAAIYRSNAGAKAKRGRETKSSIEPITPFTLSEIDKKALLNIARKSIESHLRGEPAASIEISESLRKPGAAFVTLEEKGMLRGCIGYTVAIVPLYQVVSECATKAAVADPRFAPVQLDELPKLDIEISVLTPLEQVKSLEEIQVGRDGLMISLGDYRGLLLPQVATENGWNRTQFLEETCHKAGLPIDAYKRRDATILKFQALVFGER